jgi:hypothetical protein
MGWTILKLTLFVREHKKLLLTKSDLYVISELVRQVCCAIRISIS